jgi:hypothetical protein
LPPELAAFAEINATLTRLTQDERSRALAWAAHKFGVDMRPASSVTIASPTPTVARAASKPSVPAKRVAKAAVIKKAAAAVSKPAPSKRTVKVAPSKTTKATAKKPGRPAGKAAPTAPAAKALDPKGLIQFMARHKPKTDVERLIVLAGFLAEQGQVLIETRDITAANRASGAKDFTNASATLRVSVQRALLTRVGQKVRLSASGHTLLKALSGGTSKASGPKRKGKTKKRK